MSNPSDQPPAEGLVKMGKLADIISRYVPNPAVVIDCGACDGMDAVLLHDRWPHARVIAIEGLRENYDRWLADQRGIETVHAVLSNEPGLRTWYVQNQNGLHGLYNRGMCVEERKVHCTTLLMVCRRLKITAIDVLRIDCEGAAWDVLKGAGTLLHTALAIEVETEQREYFKGQHLDVDVTGLLASTHQRVRRDGTNQFETLWIRKGLIP